MSRALVDCMFFKSGKTGRDWVRFVILLSGCEAGWGTKVGSERSTRENEVALGPVAIFVGAAFRARCTLLRSGRIGRDWVPLRIIAMNVWDQLVTGLLRLPAYRPVSLRAADSSQSGRALQTIDCTAVACILMAGGGANSGITVSFCLSARVGQTVWRTEHAGCQAP